MLLLALPGAEGGTALVQDPPAAEEGSTKTDFFSGIVTELSQTSVTVNRKGIGQDSATHTFTIDSKTRVEGKLRVRAKVTVRFVSDEQGLVAVHIIVR